MAATNSIIALVFFKLLLSLNWSESARIPNYELVEMCRILCPQASITSICPGKLRSWFNQLNGYPSQTDKSQALEEYTGKLYECRCKSCDRNCIENRCDWSDWGYENSGEESSQGGVAGHGGGLGDRGHAQSTPRESSFEETEHLVIDFLRFFIL